MPATSLSLRAPAFQRVVVPLDGTPPAEEILGHLQRMVEAIDEILLLHVVPETSFPIGASPSTPFRHVSDAEHYLLKIQSNSPRTRTRLRVETGNAAKQIAAVCREEEADLLAFTTHARHGLGSVLFGSVARDLVRTVPIPILLARPGIPRTPKRLKKILVPLGTDPAEQQLLRPVHKLALKLRAEVDLLRIDPIVLSQDPVTGVVLPLPELGAPAPAAPPLESSAESLSGVRTKTLTGQGSVAASILEQLRRTQPDLVAMNTHGRRGMDRILTGSIAEEVLRSAEVPILLQHLPKTN